MRIRSIKPEFWRSDDITGLPMATRLTFIGLWSYVDDNGVGADKLISIVADLYADDFSRDPQETVKRVTEDLQRLSGGGQVVRYRGDHNGSPKDLLYITKWKQHQVVNHPSQGHKYPLPPDETVEAANNLAPPSGDPLETLRPEQGSRGAGEGEQGSQETELVAQPENAPAPAPSPSEAAQKRAQRLPADWRPSSETKAWAEGKFGHLDLRTELEKFTNHWTAEGGQKARKLDWDAAFRNWLHNCRSPARTNGNHGPPIATSDLRVAQTQALKSVPSQRLELE